MAERRTFVRRTPSLAIRIDIECKRFRKQAIVVRDARSKTERAAELMTVNTSDVTTCNTPTQGAELLKGFTRDWAYARASEASTLFINKSVAKDRPYLRIGEGQNGCFHADSFDGRERRLYGIREIKKQRDELVFQLMPIDGSGDVESVFTFYPYWDIDDTWVVIQKIPGLEEKPIQFAIPQKLAHRIEVLPDGYP